MSTQRLNKSIREKILAALLKDLFEGREQILLNREAALAEQIRVLQIGEENLPLIEKLPDALFKHDTDVDIRGPEPDIGFMRLHFYSGKPQRYTYRNRSSLSAQCERKIAVDQIYLIDAGHPMEAPIIQYLNDTKALEDERSRIKSTMGALLNSVQSYKKLAELWPESVKYIPAAEKMQNTLPVPLEEMQKLLKDAEAHKVKT